MNGLTIPMPHTHTKIRQLAVRMLCFILGKKQPDTFDNIFQAKALVRKIFDGEKLFRTLQPTLLQIFCKIILNSKVVRKSIIDPDGQLLEELF